MWSSNRQQQSEQPSGGHGAVSKWLFDPFDSGFQSTASSNPGSIRSAELPAISSRRAYSGTHSAVTENALSSPNLVFGAAQSDPIVDCIRNVSSDIRFLAKFHQLLLGAEESEKERARQWGAIRMLLGIVFNCLDAHILRLALSSLLILIKGQDSAKEEVELSGILGCLGEGHLVVGADEGVRYTALSLLRCLTTRDSFCVALLSTPLLDRVLVELESNSEISPITERACLDLTGNLMHCLLSDYGRVHRVAEAIKAVLRRCRSFILDCRCQIDQCLLILNVPVSHRSDRGLHRKRYKYLMMKCGVLDGLLMLLKELTRNWSDSKEEVPHWQLLVRLMVLLRDITSSSSPKILKNQNVEILRCFGERELETLSELLLDFHGMPFELLLPTVTLVQNLSWLPDLRGPIRNHGIITALVNIVFQVQVREQFFLRRDETAPVLARTISALLELSEIPNNRTAMIEADLPRALGELPRLIQFWQPTANDENLANVAQWGEALDVRLRTLFVPGTAMETGFAGMSLQSPESPMCEAPPSTPVPDPEDSDNDLHEVIRLSLQLQQDYPLAFANR